ncbi:hypothetical protein QJQ45_015688 [Haematococcus lacustris]|nr:hypothetical protein QJQ45_015688 [Haematococcus lacustris]
MWHALLSCFSPGDCRAEDVDERTPWGGVSICELPADCLALIFHCGALNSSSLAAVRLVCKAWRVTLDASLPALTLLLHSPCSREKEQRRFAVRKLQHSIATGSFNSPTSRCGMGSADDTALPTCSLGQHNSSWQAAALASQPHALQPYAPMLPYLRSFSHLTSLTVKPALNVTASCLDPSGNEAVAQLLLQPVVKRLHHLCLTELGLTQLPTAVTQLQVLRRLDLSRNPLGGWKGEGLLQLAPTLTSLYCAGTCMERSPEGLHHLHQLRELVLADNGFGTCLEGLATGQLPHLTSLDISRINLMALPPALACLTALTALKVSGNRLPELPQFISQLSQLRLLDIGFQYTRDNAFFTLPQGLSALQHLKHLSVGCLGRTALASPALDSLQVWRPAPRPDTHPIRNRPTNQSQPATPPSGHKQHMRLPLDKDLPTSGHQRGHQQLTQHSTTQPRMAITEWATIAYTDGSCIKTSGAAPESVGAGVYIPENNVLITAALNDPESKTINRAELTAIHAALKAGAKRIATDSLCSLYQIRRALANPMSLITHRHNDILTAIATLIIDSPVAIQFFKVRAHSGIIGNEGADALAKHAALHPELANTPAYSPTTRKETKNWLSNAADGDFPAPLPDCRHSVRAHMHRKHKLGLANQDSIYYQMTQEITKAAAKGAGERVMIDTNISTHAQRTALLYRTGGLYNQKLAMRWKRATDDRCPLCGNADSATHLLSGCSETLPMVQERHNGAGRLITKAISKGTLGGYISFADTGSWEKGAKESLDLPSDTLQTTLQTLGLKPEDTKHTTRPDILMVAPHKKASKDGKDTKRGVPPYYVDDSRFFDPTTYEPQSINGNALDVAMELLQAIRFNTEERKFLILQSHVGKGIRDNEEAADRAMDQYKKRSKIMKKLGMSQLGDASVILIPFNPTDNHWTVAVVYVDMQKVVYYDPIAPGTIPYTLWRQLESFLKKNVRDGKWQSLRGACPQQGDGWSCGDRMLVHIDYITEQRTSHFITKIDFDNNTEEGMIGRRMCWKDAVQRCEGWPGIAGRVCKEGQEAQPSAPASQQPPVDLTVNDSDEEPVISAREMVVSAREPMATAREPMATAREPMATAREPITTAREPIATAREPIATAREPMATARELMATARELMTTALELLATALEPIATALEPLATALELMSTALEPLTTAMEPMATALEVIATALELMATALKLIVTAL